MGYQEDNIKAIEGWIEEGWRWGIPIDHGTFVRAQNGDYQMLLTPTRPIPHAWIGDVKGKKVLGLASGGGQQMPVLAAMGAICTCLDYSPKQLESERLVAKREGYAIELVRADMSKPLPFEDETFDLIVHPVSNCYIEEVLPLWKECFRILKKGGTILSGLDIGTNYLFDGEDETAVVNSLPFNPLKNPEQMKQLEDAECGVQFSHTLEEQIQGQLSAGFVLKELFEDYNDEGRLAELHVPSFIATRSEKPR